MVLIMNVRRELVDEITKRNEGSKENQENGRQETGTEG